MTVKFYADRDAMELDGVGGYYCRHVNAMTIESLHSKGDIAAELGWRDMQIDTLKAELDEARGQVGEVVSWGENIPPRQGINRKVDFRWLDVNVEPGTKLYAEPQLQPVSNPYTLNSPHFDTVALEVAREIMCDVNRRHEFLGGDCQLLSRIQCRIDEAYRAMIAAAPQPEKCHK